MQDRHGTGQTWTRRDGTGRHGAGQDRGQAWDGLQGPRGAEIWVPQGSLPEGGPGARAPASCPLSLLCNYRLTRATVEARAPMVHGGDSGSPGLWQLWGDPPLSLSCSLISCLKGLGVLCLQLQEVMRG